jgi:quercetin dioxygenase-like cupin family protein
MPFLDTNKMSLREKRPGWRGAIFSSQTMTFAHWNFDAGASIHEHNHEQEEVWHILEGELEVTIDGEIRLAGPGMVAIVPPHTTHSVKALTKGKAIVADYPLRHDF